MLTIQHLKWDSEFFKLRIGKVVIESAYDFSTLIERKEHIRSLYDLVYVFSTEKIARVSEIDKGIELVDEKIIYEMNVALSTTCEFVHLFSDSKPNMELYRLALISGTYSRFNLDKNFPENSYERLYSKWIEESVNGNLANAVFVHSTNDKIEGMITVKWKDEHADIGLVAVDSCAQGRGIGTGLIKHIITYLSQNTTVKRLFVATQMQNQKACRWYEKNGFSVKSITNIYHWWL